MRSASQLMHPASVPTDASVQLPAIEWTLADSRLEGATPTRKSSRAVRVVWLLAFVQSLAFIIVWLFMCASAGAAPAKKSGFEPELQLSSYEPTKRRDPFSKANVTSPDAKLIPGGAVAFQLEGILYQSSHPSAIVNGQLLTLDKTVTLATGNGDIHVRAVQITRTKVVLEVGGQRVELQLNAQNQPGRP